jgi:hypothetical protein
VFPSVEVSSGENEGLTLTGRVLDVAGRPVPGAEVLLASSEQKTLSSVSCEECGQVLLSCQARESGLRARAFFEQRQGFLAPRATARTDSEGRFRFKHLLGVSFSVWAKAPGFGVAMHVRAAPGEPVDLYLPAPRVLGGQVVDEAGRPVPGAHVHAVSRRTSLPYEAVTESTGGFTLSGLDEGPFYLVASAGDFLPAVKPQVEPGAQPVRLRLTVPRTLEVRVTHDGAPVAGTVRVKADHLSRQLRAEGGPARFTGLYPDEVVVTAEAAGLGSAPRTLRLEEPITQVTLELEEAGRLLVTVVDEEGQPVPQPELTLRTPSGQELRRERGATGALVELGPLVVGSYVLRARAEGFQDVERPVSVKAGETPLELELMRATLLSGQVLDAYGRPAPQVSVQLHPTGATVRTDEQGRFSAAVPTPGLYELRAHHSEWGGGKKKVTAPASGVRLELEPAASVEVTVMAGGRRVEGASIALSLENQATFHSASSSGSDGVVHMRGLQAGSYWLVASHPKYQPSKGQWATVADGQTLKVTAGLEAGGLLTGQVVDDRGTPVAGATVLVLPRSVDPVMSDERGQFELHGLRPELTYRVEAQHPRYDRVESAEGRPGGPPVTVVLERRPLFRGLVRGDDGRPVRRFRLDGRDVSTLDGRFEEPLPVTKGRILITLDAPGYEQSRVDRPAAPDLGELVLKRAPTLSGLVREENGGPVPDAVVTCEVCFDSVLSGPDGRFTLPSPAFGSQFSVSARKGRLSASRRLQRGETGTVELTLRPATRVSGTVYLPGGQPAAGYPLEGLNVDRAEPLTVVTGPDGRYSVDLSPGSYHFQLGQERELAGEQALLVRVGGEEQRLDIGPAPGAGALTVLLEPEDGWALWVVAGDAPPVGGSPSELMRTRYGQLYYQPRSKRVTLRGFPPGRYTVVWAPFNTQAPGSPVVRAVEVPAPGEVSLLR